MKAIGIKIVELQPIRKAMRYVSCLPQLKARNKVYFKLQEIEKKYKE